MDKRWFDHYEKGVPHEINADQYSSLVALFDESCKKYSELPAYSNMGTDISYAQLEELSRKFAIFLQSLGLSKGSRVAIMMPNLLQYPIALFAILRAGYIVVNTNPLYTPDEVTHQMNDSGAEAIIVLANFAHVVERALPRTPDLKHVIITEIGDLFPAVKGFIINSVVKYLKKMVPAYHIPKVIRFNEALKRGSEGELSWTILNHDDIAFLQYTGGTTGVAKGAMLTHGNMVANLLQASVWISSVIKEKQEIVITALPLYHIFSLTANCLSFIKVGAKNILITNPRDISGFVHELKKSRFSVITGVNTLFNALLHHPKFKDVDFSHLKVALSGGMALQKSVSSKWVEVTGSPVLEAYGLTETSPAVTINPMYAKGYNGSIGLPLPSTDISIRDEHGKEVAIGEKGELCIKGPQVMPGYWQRPDETALVFTKDGFLKTGDAARMDEEGYFYLVDRIKDMILVSGFNVYPNEIEQVIGMHPDVLEVGVVGVMDEEGGERVKACVVKRNPDVTPDDIIKHCREHLTAYKIPKIVEFHDELPKTNVGKILRRALRDDHAITQKESA